MSVPGNTTSPEFDNLGEIRVFVRAVREEQGLSHEELAARVGVHVNTIANVENGTTYVGTLLRVCRALGVRLKPEKVRQ